MSNERKRCPVCGKFATDAMVQKYDNLVQENKSLNNKVVIKDGTINALKKENDELKQKIETLQCAKEAALQQVEKIRARGFWARVFNK